MQLPTPEEVEADDGPDWSDSTFEGYEYAARRSLPWRETWVPAAALAEPGQWMLFYSGRKRPRAERIGAIDIVRRPAS